MGFAIRLWELWFQRSREEEEEEEEEEEGGVNIRKLRIDLIPHFRWTTSHFRYFGSRFRVRQNRHPLLLRRLVLLLLPPPPPS
jgi:hypothetical protein